MRRRSSVLLLGRGASSHRTENLGIGASGNFACRRDSGTHPTRARMERLSGVSGQFICLLGLFFVLKLRNFLYLQVSWETLLNSHNWRMWQCTLFAGAVLEEMLERRCHSIGFCMHV